MAFATGSSNSSQINVTPLIDVLLVLLVIFMVVAPSASHGLESSVPQKGASASGLSPVLVQLLGGEAGQPIRYRMGDADIAMQDLEPRMHSLFAVREDRTVFVQAAQGISYGQVAEVVARARLAGALTVGLSRNEGGR